MSISYILVSLGVSLIVVFYIGYENDKILAYLLLYVDDMLIASGNIYEIETIKLLLQTKFEMDLGIAQKILGMEITRGRQKGELYLSRSLILRK